MSHLHIPDGVLPPLLWVPGLVLALGLALISTRFGRSQAPRRLALQGALGALMLAVMSIPIPIFALEYCLTLAGPVGVLLGAAASFQVVCVVCLILALMGQGGLTVVGLNALVMGAGAAIARPVFVRVARRFGAAGSLAFATVMAQIVSGVLWFAIVAFALRTSGGAAAAFGHEAARLSLTGALVIGLWVVAIVAESAIAFGIGRFLARVRPDLLPGVADALAVAAPPATASRVAAPPASAVAPPASASRVAAPPTSSAAPPASATPSAP